MTPVAKPEKYNKGNDTHLGPDALFTLYHELVKGVQSVKMGEVYTLEEAWEEIDKI